ncbi:MAG: ArsR/SmtB family transcription factor [Blastomonas fulva]|jgi:SAM-dependent methyltransferase/DNA-binding transcriptional ArsR family regulator|uniref:ArsR family transcriptional regulator n=1 Tax=Blastomonas fulva TaxID=1550728 RepID=A0ABM6M415_9SPHN|nr:metalloregulator ArsR/SmtB family transcription factor [Blastomonas fulva]ASR50628.1 ArsR family transcriptional regulator [Blastomonas fulva]MDM7927657.1 metalloregulator ArsR/SmtB family transcription factor [Blastomonas fulva]MDM7965244.1 metalloregulator ArsR/SmtB family transcription factor [Blastomonas fulva]
MDMTLLFKALADDSRLRIMLLLQLMELSVGELAAVLDQSQPRVSRHVRILAEAGLAERHKEGSWVFLRPALPRLNHKAASLLDAFLRHDDAVGPVLSAQHAADRAQLDAIRAIREQRAADFFAQHAGQWDAIRSLHLPEADVEAALADMIRDQPLGRLLDIGTGTGRMIELFADSAEHSTALDRSPEMLRLARAKLQHHATEQVDLVQADFYALPLIDQGFDTILLHQVLHYAQNPQGVIDEAGRVAAPGARIAIVDFAPHALEELRERDAHARLGFGDDQIATMLAGAGIDLIETRSLSGGALTVKIWLGVRHGKAPPASLHPQRQQTPRKAAA